MAYLKPTGYGQRVCLSEVCLPHDTITLQHNQQALPWNGSHKRCQLLRFIGTCKSPAHITGSIPDVGPNAAGTPLLIVGKGPQDHRDNWQETKTMSSWWHPMRQNHRQESKSTQEKQNKTKTLKGKQAHQLKSAKEIWVSQEPHKEKTVLQNNNHS